MLITIFTPLYNRAKFLERIYDSLLIQNDLEIEWIIVDDGSKDNPSEILNNIKKKSCFPILLYTQENKGKHVAINKGINLAKGEFFFILDSDDFLPENSMFILKHQINKIKHQKNIAGVAGRRMYSDTTLVGDNFENPITSNSLDIRYRYNINGDLVEVFKTKVLKNYLFPEFKNEKFCPEAFVWNRIAQKFKLLFFNEPIYICEYLEDGLTDRIVKIRMESPIASMLTYSELASYNVPFIQKVKAYLNFWRFSFNSNKSISFKLAQLKYKIAALLFPIGFIMFLKDKLNN